MTDKKISELTNITGANVNDATDELAIVDASTNTTNAITRAELFSGVDAVDINGGTIDGTVIGGSTPATISGTTGAFSKLTVDPINDAGAGVFVDGTASGTSSNWGLEIGSHSVSTQSDLVFNSNAAIGSQNSLNFVAETGGIFTWNVGGASHKTGKSGSSEAMRINSSGNVGIGTTSPDYRLDVSSISGIIARFTNGSSGGTPSATHGELVVESGGANLGVQLLGTSTSNQKILFGDPVSSGSGQIVYDHSSNHMALFTSATERLRIDSSGNVGIGTTSPAAKLDVNGDAEINDLTVGKGAGNVTTNTALGRSALGANTTGDGNTSLGYEALDSNTTGRNNTAVGIRALKDVTTAGSNTAVGSTALSANTTGANNTSVGRSALGANTTGGSNTALGAQALLNSDTGISNTAIGFNALQLNTTGNGNTALGVSALLSTTTGRNNTALGRDALEDVTTGGGNIGIGFLTETGTYAPVFNPTTEDNRLVAGHTAITNAYVQVAWTVVSDARDKTAFAPVPHGLDFVNSLKPTEYQFKEGGRDGEADGIKRYGFLAQDVLELEGDDPVLVDAEDSDKLKLKESNLIPVLVNAIQELSAEVQTLKAQLEAK